MAQEAKTNFLHSTSSMGSVPQLAAICSAGVTPVYTSLRTWPELFSKTHLLYLFHAFLNMSANTRNVVCVLSQRTLMKSVQWPWTPSHACWRHTNTEAEHVPRALHQGGKSPLRNKKRRKKKKNKTTVHLAPCVRLWHVKYLFPGDRPGWLRRYSEHLVPQTDS